MNPNNATEAAPEAATARPAVGAYEDLLAFQRETIRHQSQVIEQLTGVVERLSALGKRDDIVDATILGRGY